MDTVTQVAVDGDGVLVGIEQAVRDGSATVSQPGDVALTAAELFTPQEEAFLRHYSESRLRYEAMAQAGYVVAPPTMQEHQATLRKAGELIGRAEQLSLQAICTAIGADKILFCAYLWDICRAPKHHEAIKGLQLMARIHGLWDKVDHGKHQVALVFANARQPAVTQKPADLPFTLSSGQYGVVREPDTENGGSSRPK